MLKYVNCGHLIESFAFIPSISLNWMKTTHGTAFEIQFTWLFWYINFGNVKVILDNWK